MQRRCSERGGGGVPYKKGRDARRLAWSCKFRILVSLRVFGQNAIICSREGLLYGCARRNIKVYIYTFIFLLAGESIR